MFVSIWKLISVWRTVPGKKVWESDVHVMDMVLIHGQEGREHIDDVYQVLGPSPEKKKIESILLSL